MRHENAMTRQRISDHVRQDHVLGVDEHQCDHRHETKIEIRPEEIGVNPICQ